MSAKTATAANFRQSCLARSGLAAMLILLVVAFGGHDARPAQSAWPAYADVLRPKILASISKNDVSGAVVVIKSPQGNWTEAFGKRSRNGSEDVAPSDYFRIGSITKTWTGTVILQLVEQGRLKLEDPISAYQPGVPNGERITIEMLLNMRSGLFNYTEDEKFIATLDAQPQKIFTNEEIREIAFSHQPMFDPGLKYYYSNTNTFLLGQLIEKLTGTNIREQFDARLFRPLGSKGIFIPDAADTQLPSPYVRGYQYGTNQQNGDPGLMQKAEREALTSSASMLVDQTDVSTSWAGASGMGISTAEDLARFVQALVDGAYLGKELQERRLASCAPTNPVDNSPYALRYGWGIGKLGNFYGHNGQIPGYNTVMLRDPARATTIVVLTSLSIAKGGIAPGDEIAQLIIEHFDASLQQKQADGVRGSGQFALRPGTGNKHGRKH